MTTQASLSSRSSIGNAADSAIASNGHDSRKRGSHGLDRETLVRAFRLMYLSRSLDNREVLLKRQNKIFFQISAAGHEAIQIAAGMALRPGYDWVFPYYRDRTLALTLGMTAEDMLLQAVGAARDPSSGGRQMPSHWSSPALHIVTGSSPTGTQYLHAVGCAQAYQFGRGEQDEVTLTSSGEGATSEGEFWEAINAACLEKLPVVFLIEDNGYAISVPVERQTPGGNIARLLEGFPSLLRLEVDGTDFLASYETMREAVGYCRGGHGPAFVHASVVRPYSHSLSDDERLYRSKEERDAEALRDPLSTFPAFLVEQGYLDDAELRHIRAENRCRSSQHRASRAKRAIPRPGFFSRLPLLSRRRSHWRFLSLLACLPR